MDQCVCVFGVLRVFRRVDKLDLAILACVQPQSGQFNAAILTV